MYRHGEGCEEAEQYEKDGYGGRFPPDHLGRMMGTEEELGQRAERVERYKGKEVAADGWRRWRMGRRCVGEGGRGRRVSEVNKRAMEALQRTWGAQHERAWCLNAVTHVWKRRREGGEALGGERAEGSGGGEWRRGAQRAGAHGAVTDDEKRTETVRDVRGIHNGYV